MKPHDLQPAERSRKLRKRVGRGEAASGGKTAGRGTKGTKARGRVRPGFEGGQMPLIRRVPKLKGFKPPRRDEFGVVNLSEVASVQGDDVGPDELRGAGLVRKRHRFVKVLGEGDVGGSLTVRAHAFSDSARRKIEEVGGTVEPIEFRPGGRKETR